MNLNRVILIGRMAADPETRSTQSGQQVATLRVATNRVWNDKNGAKQEAVEFHTIVAWGGLADVAGKYLKKGQLAFFEGRLQTRSWQGKDGVKRYSTEIVAENLQLGPKAAGISAPPAQSAPREREMKDEEIPVIEADAPLSNPLGKEESVEEAEIDLKDIPF
jgi:single-strand DNA-binding protein